MKRVLISGLIVLSLVSQVVAQANPPSEQKLPALWLGTAWYPEHWPEERWERDLQLMKGAGINFVRIGEFAWSRMEPLEGKFQLEWLDRAVAAAQKQGLFVVIGTPTAAPPAWMTQKYPDTLRTEENGRKAVHGNRQHFSFTSPRYRDFCKRIATELAKRYGRNPWVVGWQIDNEYATYSYDDYTKQQFQQWLKNKYKSLDSLNAHWSAAYWSQDYFSWDQIPIPIGYNNPSLMLEWKRFVSDVYKSYQHDQLAVIRAHADKRQFITHNFMGWFDGFDHYVLNEELDFASWDNYVGKGHLDYAANGMVHDLTRGFKRKNYWVMETQPGNVNWQDINNALDKGEVRQMAWQAIGHGSDAVSYWQWRSALGGQEQIHGTLVAPDGQPVPLYEEVKQIGAEFAKAAEVLRDTQPIAQVAMLHDYDSRWAIQFQKHHKDFDTFGEFRTWYRPVKNAFHNVDVVNPNAPLNTYTIVFAPQLNVLPDSVAQKLVDYVKQGGHLVLGPRSGQKDEYNALHAARQPGRPLIDLLGGQVEQYYALLDPVPVEGQAGKGEARIWAERLQILGAETQPYLYYGKSNGWLDSQPAVITRQVGNGRISYIGAWLDDATMDMLVGAAMQDRNMAPMMTGIPKDVEICQRSKGEQKVYIIINHGKETREVVLPRPMKDVLRGGTVSSVKLTPRDVAVVAE